MGERDRENAAFRRPPVSMVSTLGCYSLDTYMM